MNSTSTMRTLFLTLVIALVVSLGARAGIVHNSTGLISPARTLTFDEISVPSFTHITNQYAQFGVNFAVPDPNYVEYLPPGFLTGFPHVGGFSSASLSWFVAAASQVHPWALQFSRPTTGVAFAMVLGSNSSNAPLAGEPVTFSSYLHGSLVEEFGTRIDMTSTSNFFGFTDSLFDEIRISFSPATVSVHIDNLQTATLISAVPEPSTLLSGSLALILLLSSRCWRKSHPHIKPATLHHDD